MKLSDWLPSVFVEGDGDDIQVSTKKFSQFPTVSGEGVQGVGIKDGNNVKFDLTTDSISVNPNTFRNEKGQFIGTPEELEALKNQRDVNEFFYNAINDIEQGDIDLEGYATEAQLNEVENASIFRDETIKTDLEDKDKKQTAAILVVEAEVRNEANTRFLNDDKLQEQIDALAAGDIDLSPVEDRLDSIEAVLPKTPLVVDPVEIGEQTLKITGNRPSGAGGEAGSVLMWKAEPGSGGSPYNECKFVVPDTSAVDPAATVIWWKQGDKIQRWDMGGAGWFTSGNVLHYSASETFGDTLVDGQPIELFYVDPALTGDDFADAISRVESKADDRKLQVEIEELALALETLLVQKEHGQWKYIGFTGDTIPRNAGEFGLAVADIASSQENIITLNQEDLKGITHGFADVDVGDYIEVVNVDEPSSYALFVVTKAPEGTGIVNVEVALKDTGYNIWNGETCEIRFFAVNEQDLQLEDLDNRYLRLAGGTMDGGATLRVNTLEPVNMPFIYYEGDPDNTHAAGLINRYMMMQYAVSKTGGDEMEGPLHVKGHSGDSRGTSRIKTLGVYSNSSSALRLGTTTDRVYIEDDNTKFNGGVLVDNIGPKSEDGRGVTLNVEGTNDTHLVTKGYVDSKVGGGGGGSPVSAKLQAGFQLWSGSRLAEGCFNLTDENGSTTSNCKVARGLAFHTYQGFDEWPWMKYALRSGGQIHLTDVNGKYLMSKPVLSAEKRDAPSGDDPVGAIWHFEFSIYGMEAETSLSGLYFLEFENCLEAS